MGAISKAATISAFFLLLLIHGCVQQSTPESQSQSCAAELDFEGSCTTLLDPVCGLNGRTYTNCCYAQRDNAIIEKLGACDALGCTDNDSGYNLALAGTAEARGVNGTDSCIDFSTLNEFECRYGQVFNSSVPCPSGRCEDGRCLSCVDTDIGPDIYAVGEVRYFYGPYSYEIHRDECMPPGYQGSCTEFYNDSSSPTGYDYRTVNCSQSELLIEYDCKYDNIASYYVNCPSGSGCLDGRCVYG